LTKPSESGLGSESLGIILALSAVKTKITARSKLKMKFAYGTKMVEVKSGVVVASNEAAFPIGKKVNAKFFRLAGWRKVMVPKVFYVKGLTGGKTFYK